MATGILGDVKNSILDPQKFVRLNGAGWVLMDGRNINNSDLFHLTGMTMIPDARGVFIRSMNENRDTNLGDTEGNRSVGVYQTDEVKQHNHQYTDIFNPDDVESDNSSERAAGVRENAVVKTTSDYGGKETRPRNIALYTYIKVNN